MNKINNYLKSKNISKNNLLLLTISTISLIIYLLVWKLIPEIIPIEFTKDRVRSFMEKSIIIYIFPIISILMALLLFIVPRSDNKIKYKKKDVNYYNRFSILFIIIMNILIIFPIYFILIEIKADIYIKLFISIVSLILFLIGIIHFKNIESFEIMFITPWSIKNNNNSNKSRKTLGIVFMLAGLTLLINTLLFSINNLILMVIIMLLSFGVLASYFISYQDSKKTTKILD